MVMYQGRIVEQGRTDQIIERPQHSYTRALLAASPVPDDAQSAARVRYDSSLANTA